MVLMIVCVYMSPFAGVDHEDLGGDCSHLHPVDVGRQAGLPTHKAQAGHQAWGAMCTCRHACTCMYMYMYPLLSIELRVAMGETPLPLHFAFVLHL